MNGHRPSLLAPWKQVVSLRENCRSAWLSLERTKGARLGRSVDGRRCSTQAGERTCRRLHVNVEEGRWITWGD